MVSCTPSLAVALTLVERRLVVVGEKKTRSTLPKKKITICGSTTTAQPRPCDYAGGEWSCVVWTGQRGRGPPLLLDARYNSGTVPLFGLQYLFSDYYAIVRTHVPQAMGFLLAVRFI